MWFLHRGREATKISSKRLEILINKLMAAKIKCNKRNATPIHHLQPATIITQNTVQSIKNKKVLVEFKKEDRLSRQLGSAFWTTGFSISNQIGKLSDCSFFSTLEFRNTQRIDNWLSNLQAIQELKLMHRAA